MGEKETVPFRCTFNGFLKVAFQGSRVTSDAGLILVRGLDERLGLQAMITVHLRDTRQGLNTQVRLPDLFRQSVYSYGVRVAKSGRNTGEVSQKCPRTRSLPARATAM